MISKRRLTAAIVALGLPTAAVSFWLRPAWALAFGLSAAASLPLVLQLASTRRRRRMTQRARALAAKVPPAGLVSVEEWLAPAQYERVNELLKKRPMEPITLGQIDNDGRVLSFFGELPGFEQVDSTTFVERYRFGLDLVVVDRAVLIRKDYCGNRDAFLREWLSLATLGKTSCTPIVHRVDEQRLLLFKSYVPGSTLRQRLVESGARILSIDTESDPQLAGLSPEHRLEAVWARGREHFAAAFEPAVLDLLVRMLDEIHRRGVTGFSLSFGNVVLEELSGHPWFIDFDSARTHNRPRGFVFNRSCSRDRRLVNRIYGHNSSDRRNGHSSGAL